MKTRRTRLVSRGRGQRDARLFIIAPEGNQTEGQYFEGLQRQGVIDRRRVIIEVVSRSQGDGRSAPEYVIERLDEYKERHELNERIDQLWLVLDCDHWIASSHIHNLTEVIQRAQQKGYRVAVSNPCFELWLLLHFTADVDEIRGITAPSRACKACQRRIRELWGSYDKSKIRAERYTAESVGAAIQRAQALDTTPDDRWPQSTGTHVHRLAEELMEQSRRNATLPRQDGLT